MQIIVVVEFTIENTLKHFNSNAVFVHFIESLSVMLQVHVLSANFMKMAMSDTAPNYSFVANGHFGWIVTDCMKVLCMVC